MRGMWRGLELQLYGMRTLWRGSIMELAICEICKKRFEGHTLNQVNMQLVIHTNFKHPTEQKNG